MDILDSIFCEVRLCWWYMFLCLQKTLTSVSNHNSIDFRDPSLWYLEPLTLTYFDIEVCGSITEAIITHFAVCDDTPQWCRCSSMRKSQARARELCWSHPSLFITSYNANESPTRCWAHSGNIRVLLWISILLGQLQREKIPSLVAHTRDWQQPRIPKRHGQWYKISITYF